MAAFHWTILLLSIYTLIISTITQGPQDGDEGFHYGAKTTTDDILNDIGNLTTLNQGKIAIVTGATSGLGRETVLALVQTSCKVIMAVRDVAKGQKEKLEIIKESIKKLRKRGYSFEQIQSAHELLTGIAVWELDLASLQSVLDFSKKVWREVHGKIDYLILNAGTK